jgi:hypothetical protein
MRRQCGVHQLLKKLIIGLFSALLSMPFGVPVRAQQPPVFQSGNVTAGHIPVWASNGVVSDSGSSADSSITSLGVTGQICSNSNHIPSGAWNALCFQAFTNSPAIISLQNFGTAPPESIVFNINGSSQGFPTVSPLPVVVGDIVCFTTTGGGLKDCGSAPSTNPLVVGTTPISGGTSSRVLFDNAGKVGEYPITGTGSVALSASPTFTGTPVLSTPTATSLALGGATIGGNAFAVTGTSLFNSAITYGGVALNNAVTGTGNMVLSASPTLTGTTLAPTIAGGSAPGSTLTLESTSNGSPSGDSTTINGTTITIANSQGAASTINLGRAGGSGAQIVVAGTASGSTLLQASSAASGTLTLPAATGTLAASASAPFTLNTSTGNLTLNSNSIWLGRQTFCASGCTATGGTYTPDTGTNEILARCIGGGGGGGGAAATTGTQAAIGVGGAAGGYNEGRFTSAFSGITVTIGAAGSAGATGNNAGGNGGATTFGALLTANGGNGGSGGVAAAAGGALAGVTGGSASGGDINVQGAYSLGAAYYSVAVVTQSAGANSQWGAGGLASATATGSAGNNGVGHGSGGSGGANAASQASALAGGAGTGGMCVVDEYR